jgi:hypothetical protein
MTVTMPSDAQKQQVWAAYRSGAPTRVPVMLSTNPRVVIENPQWNPDRFTFEQCQHDPQAHLEMVLIHELYRRRVLHRYSDGPTELPEVWEVGQVEYNVYEAAQLGATVCYPPGQVPVTEPPFADDDCREDVFDQDIEQPLSSAYWRERLAFWERLDALAGSTRFEGRPVRLLPLAPMGTDGPVTVASNLRGAAFMMDLAADPEYADRLMAFVCAAVDHRRRAWRARWGDRVSMNGAFVADDSCALIGLEMYRRQVLPHHRRLYDAMGDGPRGMHMCGHATHLFATLHRELNVTSFDTGFPVDHGRLRRELGPQVEILGGPEVDLLLHGTPDAVHERTRAILASGVTEGGRFVLREANNLPPHVPEANLAAMYDAALRHPLHGASGRAA